MDARVLDVPAERNVRVSAAAQIALLGTGTVGGALLGRLERLGHGLPPLRLVHVANSRRALFDADGLVPAGTAARLRDDGIAAGRDVLSAFDGRAPAIVIDATGSEAVASRHADWLA
ncbi:MAG TPA: homoserine dehydrogenase, partial [Lysobacter sp.]